MFSSTSDNWETPMWLFNKLNAIFKFTLDPCADEKNNKCLKYFTKEHDGLTQCWGRDRVFCNPPYGRNIGKWVEKCYKHSINGGLAVMLLPARTDTKWFHRFIYNKFNAEIIFLKGRLKFGEAKNSAPFPSMIVVFGDKEELELCQVLILNINNETGY